MNKLVQSYHWSSSNVCLATNARSVIPCIQAVGRISETGEEFFPRPIGILINDIIHSLMLAVLTREKELGAQCRILSVLLCLLFAKAVIIARNSN